MHRHSGDFYDRRSFYGSSYSSLADSDYEYAGRYYTRDYPRPASRHAHMIVRAPTPPPVVKRVVERAPTPPPEIVEKVVVHPAPPTIIERVIEQPQTPPPIVRHRMVPERPRPPVVRTRIVKVPNRTSAYSYGGYGHGYSRGPSGFDVEEDLYEYDHRGGYHHSYAGSYGYTPRRHHGSYGVYEY